MAWLVLAVPMFLRMPETNDAEMFDLQAWLIADGGVMYRDVLEPNLPGVVWIHLLVRTIGGSSSEALRFFDLLSFGLVMSFAWRLLKMSGASGSNAMWTVLGCSMFYLSTSEWCHCQRDMWMLAPAMAGTWLRLKQRERAESETPGGRLLLWGILEGLIWGVGIWIKPHVLLVTVAVWLCTLSRKAGLKRTAFDSAGLLVGGLIAGGVGFGWMVSTGAWSHWLDTMQNWNPRYLQAGRENWTFARLKVMVIRFLPWFLLHLAAVPLALKLILQRVAGRGAVPADANDNSTALGSPVLASVYLVWMIHSFLLQHLFDYVHAPGIVLAILVCAAVIARAGNRSGPRLMVMLFGVAVVATSPILKPKSLPIWRQCVSRDRAISPQLQDQLTHFDNPRRTDLAAISGFLNQQQVSGQDVLIFNSDGVSLYRRLNLKPPSPYAYFFETLIFFPDKRDEVILEAMASEPRFIVLDLVSSLAMSSAEAHAVGPDGEHAPPPAYRPKKSFPWKYPVVFRAGSWLGIETGGPEAE
ncbi:MAG: hypothetical protein H8E37_08045 [Planctomycetes bacterium]|nr:hypothetical protein [Planctomycetota bacterium]